MKLHAVWRILQGKPLLYKQRFLTPVVLDLHHKNYGFDCDFLGGVAFVDTKKYCMDDYTVYLLDIIGTEVLESYLQKVKQEKE